MPAAILIPEDIPQIEAELEANCATVDQLCYESGINRSTWTRWKSGATKPSLEKWLAVLDTLDRLKA